ncbi:oligosaccharide flippase family protein [Escherichia coli]|uniref:oligosaccharide flippase family protein n=1 Tax=Escherichia coli TaxID=562 RepID=UPI00128F6D53|nr:oligosaccharide flippase family protein [Escherichia coli]EFK8875501.1 oligosaccharide flippase family protein [Escherichia coli]MCH6770179.1 polysaccharide biosynthesis protein [Escherichia coli]MCX9323953.1 oligosaccharide flippase family protein [Escherichia coli]MCX9802574.1 oligosaccharide flippase family protein [Escherichia coli]MQJ79157.1 flippase [Escherichia coli]
MSNKKEIIKNLISFGTIDVLGLLIPIVTMPILTRALGPSQYGELLLLLTMLYFGHTIIDYGTQFTAVRKLANVRNNKHDINNIYSDNQSLRLVLCLLYLIGLIVYCFVFSLHDTLNNLIIFGSMYLIGYTLSSPWFFQGIGAVEQLMKVSLTAKLINLVIILFFVNSPKDLTIAIAAFCLPILFSGLYLTTYIYLKYKLSIPKFNKLLNSLKDGKDVFIGLLAPNFYNTIPTIVLGSIYPPSEFVNFAIASRLASVVVTIQDVVAKALYPVLSKIKESPVIKLLLLNSIISIFPIAFLLIWGERCLLFFLGKNFSGANLYLIIFTIGVLFIGLSNAFSKGFFLPKGLDRIYRNISLRISILSAVICIFFIYYFGLIGGAISITLARFLFFMDYYLTYIKFKKNHC